MYTMFKAFDKPKEISLSLSSICNAQCLWCPIGRHLNTSKKSKFMSVPIVEKILKDLKGRHVDCFFFADNGEPLLNPDFKIIIEMIRKEHPEAMLWLASNFYLMDEVMAGFVLSNFSSIGLNIDGITEAGYYAVKKLPLKVVMANFLNFMNLRYETHLKYPNWNPVIQVSVITPSRYYNEIGEPEKITIPDETRMTVAQIRRALGEGDVVQSSSVITWAERRKWNIPRTKDNGICTNFHVIGKKCCIDTDGNMISCCQDFDSEYKFGNVMNNTIDEIWTGERRKRFIDLLIAENYAEIGFPCSNCQD